MSNGRVAFLKLLRPGEKGSYMSELDTYEQVREATLPENLQISRLYGIVRDDDGISYGLLPPTLTLPVGRYPAQRQDQGWTSRCYRSGPSRLMKL